MTAVTPDRRKSTFVPLLPGDDKWRTAEPVTVRVDPQPGGGIALKAAQKGVLSSADPFDSIGGLVLPRRMAIAHGGPLHLIDNTAPAAASVASGDPCVPAGAREDSRECQPQPSPGAEAPCIRRFDAATGTFLPLPGLGGRRASPRDLVEPRAIAVSESDLVVVDEGSGKQARVRVFDRSSMGLRGFLEPLRGGGMPKWKPCDVAFYAGRFYILDAASPAFVWAFDAFTLRGRRVLDLGAIADESSRIVIDRGGRLVLLRSDKRLDVFDRPRPEPLITKGGGESVASLLTSDGAYRLIETVDDPGALRSQFDPLPIGLQRIADPAGDAANDRRAFSLIPGRASPCLEGADSPPDPLFDFEGQLVPTDSFDPGDMAQRLPPFEREGTWYSKAIDSGIHACAWDRIEVTASSLPEGSSALIYTHTSDEPSTHPQAVQEDEWSLSFVFRAGAGAGRPPGEQAEEASPVRGDGLAQSRPGRHLNLRVVLAGDGYGTPVISSFVVHYPRRSWAERLPAVYAQDRESYAFLERFMAAFQVPWEEMRAIVDDMSRWFDPETVPDGAGLAFLAGWFDVHFEDEMSPAVRRDVLKAAIENLRRRGTPDAVRRIVAAYLYWTSGVSPEKQEQLGYPKLVEGFRRRTHFALPVAPESDEDDQSELPLAGSEPHRMQLGVNSRLGEGTLVDYGDPALDVFLEHAHRFTAYVPSAWVRTTADMARIRRALRIETPAHVASELCLVDAACCIGLRSTVGLDTIVAAPPAARLAPEDPSLQGPALPPHPQLGIDTVLAAGPGPTGVTLLPGIRLDGGSRIS